MQMSTRSTGVSSVRSASPSQHRTQGSKACCSLNAAYKKLVKLVMTWTAFWIMSSH